MLSLSSCSTARRVMYWLIEVGCHHHILLRKIQRRHRQVDVDDLLEDRNAALHTLLTLLEMGKRGAGVYALSKFDSYYLVLTWGFCLLLLLQVVSG